MTIFFQVTSAFELADKWVLGITVVILPFLVSCVWSQRYTVATIGTVRRPSCPGFVEKQRPTAPVPATIPFGIMESSPDIGVCSATLLNQRGHKVALSLTENWHQVAWIHVLAKKDLHQPKLNGLQWSSNNRSCRHWNLLGNWSWQMAGLLQLPGLGLETGRSGMRAGWSRRS